MKTKKFTVFFRTHTPEPAVAEACRRAFDDVFEKAGVQIAATLLCGRMLDVRRECGPLYAASAVVEDGEEPTRDSINKAAAAVADELDATTAWVETSEVFFEQIAL